MSGHSKWANIKRKKGANDKIKANVFAKMSHQITIAVIEGGGITEPENNVKLRLAMDKAKSANMPKENIKRAIEKGFGPNKILLKEVIYEGFGPYGIFLLILSTTDNSNRTTAEIRNFLEKNSGKLGTQGSVSYLFNKCAFVSFQKSEVNEEAVFKIGEELEAFDINEDESHFFVFFPFDHFGLLKAHLNNIKYDLAEIDYLPTTPVSLESDKEKRALDIIEALEGLDDVQRVYTNLV
ncbi:putative transcriptional regulatory protein Paes_0496 [Candidatus Roizmanbacteria bacterium]|nr:putative transcriptional regulatory protein Paes_0496 [Candidatus Roizmanbacteria bacterium]